MLGNLSIRRVPCDHNDATARRLDQRSVIGCVRARSMRGAQSSSTKCLRRLHGNETITDRGVDHHTEHIGGIGRRRVEHFDRVGDGDARNRGVGSCRNRIDDSLIDVSHRKRTRCIMDTDHFGRGRHVRKTRTNGLAACASPRNPTLAHGVSARNHGNNTVRARLGNIARNVDHTAMIEQVVLLRTPVPAATATRDNDRPDF